MSQMNLYPYQKTHFDRLVNILSHNKIAIDCSKTGSGKTVVAMHLISTFFEKNTIDRVIVVSPPTLTEHWKKYIDQCLLKKYQKQIECVSSHSLHKLKVESDKKYFLIVDECHLFKNSVQRTIKIKNIIRKSSSVLMLSATPYDDKRQYNNIRQLFQLDSDIKEQLSCMEFEYSTHTEYDYYHIVQDEDTRKLYDKGYRAIYNASKKRRNEELVVFNPKLFTKGIQHIHNSLIEGMIQYTKSLLENEPNSKIVIVLNFIQHFERFRDELNDVKLLTLNGKTPISERHQIIRLFQQSNLNYRVICISGEVGSVGIELDDKHGQFPRHMVILPMTNAINFCQAIGRIQRSHTQSHSRVSVIQPVRENTYFKSQIGRKFQVLEQFMNIPIFESLYQNVQ